MGTGASNQVRSNLDDANISPLKTKANIFFARTDNITNNQSETIAYQSHQTLKNQHALQKAEIRSLPSPSYHVRKSSQVEDENVFTKVSRRELHQKIRELESALAVSESHKLDLQDQLQALEGTVYVTTEQSLPDVTTNTSTLHETLKAKDQHIKKLEEDFNNAQTDYQKRALKFKKRIRGLTKQIFELRQEALITQMEMRTELTQQIEPNENHQLNTSTSSKDKGVSLLESLPNTSHTKVIVELSSQISEQEEQIARLTTEIVEKDKRIQQLEAALMEAPPTVTTSPHSEVLSNNAIASSSDRTMSFKGDKHENAFNNTIQLSSFDHIRNKTSTTKGNNNSLGDAHHKTVFEYHSTALSDSDSDWEEGSRLPQVHRHSAPAHSRGKNNLSKPYTKNTASEDDVDRYMNSFKISKSITSDHSAQSMKQL